VGEVGLAEGGGGTGEVEDGFGLVGGFGWSE
jgi:hypothetical protein